MTNEDLFRELQANKSMIMACLQSYQEYLPFAFFFEFIQTHKTYPIVLDKICIVT